jgi:hypothetical protein
MAFDKLRFVASEYLQNSLSGLVGVIGGYKSSSHGVKFDDATLALNVNDRVTVRSNQSGDVGLNVILVGRNSVGAIINDTVQLNGTGLATGILTFRHVLRVNTFGSSGELSINRLSDNSGLITVVSGVSSVKNLFSVITKNTSTYEKVFLENTSNSNALLNGIIYESTNPDSAFSFALATSKNDTETITSLTTAPTGCTSFTNLSKSIPSGILRPGECIGVWIKCDTGSGTNVRYGLSCAGAASSLSETGVVGGGGGGSPPVGGSGVLTSAYIEYSGSFSFPLVPGNDYSGYFYVANGMAYNPANNSLFSPTHTYFRRIGEIGIPTLVKLTGSNDFSNLNRATSLQDPISLDPGLQNYALESTVNIAGLVVADGKLVITYHEFYDGNSSAEHSHLILENPSNLATSAISGLYRVGPYGAGYSPGITAGYMCTVPLQHTGVLNCRYMTGQGGMPIISRGSNGPSIHGFNPHNLPNSGNPFTTFLRYTQANEYPGDLVGDEYLEFTTIVEYGGAFFPEDTTSLVVTMNLLRVETHVIIIRVHMHIHILIEFLYIH